MANLKIGDQIKIKSNKAVVMGGTPNNLSQDIQVNKGEWIGEIKSIISSVPKPLYEFKRRGRLIQGTQSGNPKFYVYQSDVELKTDDVSVQDHTQLPPTDTKTTTGTTSKIASTTTTTMTDKQAQDVGSMMGVDLERMKKIATATYVASTVGMLAGLGLAFKKKKSVGGYILFAVLGSISGAVLGNLGSRPFIKKTGAADAGSGDTGSKKAGGSTDSTPTDAEGIYNKMADIAAKIPNGKQPTDAMKQSFIKAYNTLSDAEKNAYNDTITVSLDCFNSTKDTPPENMMFLDCMTGTKMEAIVKKHTQPVLESANKKMGAAMGG